MINEQLEKIKKEALDAIAKVADLDGLNDVRVQYLGKKGELTAVLKSLKDVAPEDRPKVGQLVNDARAIIEESLNSAKDEMSRKAMELQMRANNNGK